ncbi:MAG: sulfatase, partial [Halobacteriaceae archaeon]
MNVLLLTVDSLRADRVSAERGLTPRIDALGRDGAAFEQAVTHGHGTPVAFPAILSGTYPMLYGGCSELAPERPVLARFLQDAGYETAAFTSNPHLFERYGYDIGFDVFNEYSETGDGDAGGSTPLIERVRERLKHHLQDGSLAWNLLRRVYYLAMTVTEQRPYAPADAINGHVLDWLDGRDGDRPFFVWAHYMDTHYPFYQGADRLDEVGADPIPTGRQRRLNRLMNESPEQLSSEDVADLNALYDAETRFVDEHVGALLDELDRRGLREETLVVLTSDHGEALGEHDAFGHYQALYEELVRVPLVVAGPDVPAATVEHQTGLVDIAPTVLDYAGVEHSAPFSGESVRPWLEDGVPDVPRKPAQVDGLIVGPAGGPGHGGGARRRRL